MTTKDKFLTLVSKEETKTVARAKSRLANKNYSKISNLIAFEILERIIHVFITAITHCIYHPSSPFCK